MRTPLRNLAVGVLFSDFIPPDRQPQYGVTPTSPQIGETLLPLPDLALGLEGDGLHLCPNCLSAAGLPPFYCECGWSVESES